MPDELLTIFKVCFLVLLYLFFFRVLRAVWTEVNAAPAGGAEPVAPAKPPKASRRTRAKESRAHSDEQPALSWPTVLVAVDPPQMAGIEYPLSEEMTVGRGVEADVVLDDGFLSQRHATFHWRDDEWVIEDLGSTNGTYVNNVKVDRLARLHLGDRVQLGNVILEVR